MVCNILFISNKDIKNPIAGGGTWEGFRLANLLANRGYSVKVLCPNFKGGKSREYIGKIEIIRKGSYYNFYPNVVLSLFKSKEIKEYDVIVELILVGIPFFTPIYIKKPVIGLCWHLPRETYFMEFSDMFGSLIGNFLASFAYLIEGKIFPKIYEKIPIFTFSESTKNEMIKLGFKNIIMIKYALAKAIMLKSLDPNIKLNLWYNKNIPKTDYPSILYLGRLKKYKGIQDVIKAMKIIIKKIPDARLFIVGKGSYENYLKNLTKKLSLEKNVLFLGYIPVKEKIKILHKSHVLVMPSYKEGFPTPVFEANMCGTPTIVTNALGVEEAVENGKTGFIYPKGDFKKLSEYIILLFKDKELYDYMRKNALNQARKFIKMITLNEKLFINIFENKIKELIK